MKNEIGNRTENSIFVKLLLVFFFMSIGVIIAVLALLAYLTDNFWQGLENQDVGFVDHLINEIGDFPNYKRALQLKRKEGLLLRYQGVNEGWTTYESLPFPNELSYEPIVHKTGIRFVDNYLKSYAVLKNGQSLYVISTLSIEQSVNFRFIIMYLTMLMLCFLFVGYLALRSVLKPIHALEKGVYNVTKGNFDFLLPVKKNDELGRLSKAFNLMIHKVDEMIHSKDQLLFNVSHELRSPLTRMKLTLAFLPDSGDKSDLKKDISTLDNMLEELLKSARLKQPFQHLQYQAGDLSILIKHICKQFKDRKPEVVFQCMPGKWKTKMDRQHMETVFKNLIENAVKYSSDSNPPIEVKLEKKRDLFEIRIKDFGRGIPQKDIPFIFEPFYRVDKFQSSNVKGYGLGLNICKILVEAHKGTISISSQPKKGTEVLIQLPA